MSTDTVFQKNLELGIKGEEIVYDYLKRNNSFVEDLRSQKHGEHAGPRLIGTEGAVVLPDFAVYNKNEKKGNYAVDVKVKSSLYPYKGVKCFTVDEKIEDYKRAVQIKKLDMLKLIFIHNNRLYLYEADMVFGREIVNNQYGKIIYYFKYEESNIIY